jgi:hypothetical protein
MQTFTIVISIIALLLSFVNFYFHFIYNKDAIACTIVGFDVNKERAAVQIAISNAGTRPIMLKDARLLLEFKAKMGGKIFRDDINHHNLREPILIPKNEIRSVLLTFPIDDNLKRRVTSWHDSGMVVDSDGSWPIRARLNFVTVSGKLIDSEETVITIKWNNDGFSFSWREEPTWRIGSWEFEKIKSLIQQ